MKPSFINYLTQQMEMKNPHHPFLPFADFMALALYHPEYGFYNSAEFHIGSQPNAAYTTAAEISPLFAQCFAKQCLQLFREYDLPTNILEIGAGSGRFAFDLLTQLQKEAPFLSTNYYIYDVSHRLIKQQQTLLTALTNTSLPNTSSSTITWLNQLPKQFSGIIIANELLDALPVHCFRIGEDGRIMERCVGIDTQQQTLVWKNLDANDHNFHHPQLASYVTELYQTYDLACGYESEINLNMKTWMQEVTKLLNKGVIWLTDYGYGQREYYHPERFTGTLATIHKGQRLHDPLQFPGEQDITAHVDFTRVAEYGVRGGCELLGYTSQAAFLLSLGLLDLAREEESRMTIKQCVRLHQAIKYLTLPTEMGERIKVMALAKGLDGDGDGDKGEDGGGSVSLQGFQLKDHRRDL